jgi:hypothetical protein
MARTPRRNSASMVPGAVCALGTPTEEDLRSVALFRAYLGARKTVTTDDALVLARQRHDLQQLGYFGGEVKRGGGPAWAELSKDEQTDRMRLAYEHLVADAVRNEIEQDGDAGR